MPSRKYPTLSLLHYIGIFCNLSLFYQPVSHEKRFDLELLDNINYLPSKKRIDNWQVRKEEISLLLVFQLLSLLLKTY